MNLLANPR